MKIFVTGACGFIGSHLTEALVEEGRDVTAMAIYSARDTYGWLDGIDVRKVRGDVRDPELMRRLVKGHDVVYHLAAIGGIPDSYTMPRTVWETNATGTLNVLEACREADAKIIHTSTSEVYGTALYTPQDEKHPLCAQSPYAASKSAADKLVESYRKAFDLRTAILRPFNTYGPRQSQRAFIPSVISQMLGDRDHVEVGDLTPTRDMNYVSDTVDAFLLMMDLEGEYNVGSGVQVSMDEIYHTISAIVGNGKPAKIADERFRPADSEVMALEADATKIRQKGWSPKVSLEGGLRKTTEWSVENDTASHSKFKR